MSHALLKASVASSSSSGQPQQQPQQPSSSFLSEQLASLRRDTSPDGTNGSGGGSSSSSSNSFSLAQMRERLQGIKADACLAHCLAVDKKRSGRLGACDFEVVLQRCGVALTNPELASL